MLTCPNCYKDLPDDADYCSYCGKPLTAKAMNKKKEKLRKNTRKNQFAVLGLFLLIIGLFGCDFIIAIIINAMGGNTVIPFYISLVLYLISMICGIMSLYVDYKDKKAGFEPAGNKNYAFVCIFISLFVSLVNLTQIILK